ncbi:MAG: ADP-ribosyltransferase [Spirochaetaceae bacterium]|jgi:hypothetical protein|nr:ADP-ribosyltransferase [Spirochaetaceae bacterium]
MNDEPGNLYGKKLFNEIISAFIVIFFLCGDLVSCQKNEQIITPYVNNNTVDFFVVEESRFKENDSFQEYVPDNFTVSNDLILYFEEKFKGELEEVFISSITVNELPEISNIIDPEHKLDTKKITANLAVGGVIILICVLIPAVTPGLAPQAATALLAVPAGSLIGAAVDTAISGIISYVKNKGDLEAALYDSIEAGSEGFKYGAIFGAGASVFTALKTARAAKKGADVFADAKLVKTARSRATAAAEVKPVAFIQRNLADDAAQYYKAVSKGLPKDEFIKKYGRQSYDDFVAWTGKDYKEIQEYLRTGEGVAAIKIRANRIAALLKNHVLGEQMTLYRGENIPRDALAEIFNLHNVRGKTYEELVEMLKNAKSFTITDALMSTSKKGGMNTVKKFAAQGSGKPNPDKLKIIREIKTSPETFGIDISGISKFSWQEEVLLPKGVKTKVVDAYVEKVVSGGKIYKVIHVVEEVM